MSRTFSTKNPEIKPTPVVNVKNAVEAMRRNKSKPKLDPQYMIGVLVGYKSQPSGFKNEKTGEDNPYHIYTFKLVETDMDVTIRDASGEDVDVPVSEGDLVAVFAPTRLHNGLRQTENGMKLKFAYLGQPKKAHEYSDVTEVI